MSNDDLDKWMQQWDSAVKSGFLGLPENQPTPPEEIAYEMGEDGVLIETKVNSKAYVDKMTYSPNPIRAASVGKDQDLENPISIGATYDVADLEGLESLKVKLHDLLGKLNGLEGMGQSNAALESQIKSLEKQIDEISDNLSRGVPSPQGD